MMKNKMSFMILFLILIFTSKTFAEDKGFRFNKSTLKCEKINTQLKRTEYGYNPYFWGECSDWSGFEFKRESESNDRKTVNFIGSNFRETKGSLLFVNSDFSYCDFAGSSLSFFADRSKFVRTNFSGSKFEYLIIQDSSIVFGSNFNNTSEIKRLMLDLSVFSKNNFSNFSINPSENKHEKSFYLTTNGAVAEGNSFENASLLGAWINNITLNGSNNFSNTNLTSAKFTSMTFMNINLIKTIFDKAEFADVVFDHVNLKNVQAIKAKSGEYADVVNDEYANLKNEFSKAIPGNLKFKFCEFENVNFSGSYLIGAVFELVKFSGANLFDNGNFTKSSFDSFTQFDGVQFMGSVLRFSKFNQTKMLKVNFFAALMEGSEVNPVFENTSATLSDDVKFVDVKMNNSSIKGRWTNLDGSIKCESCDVTGNFDNTNLFVTIKESSITNASFVNSRLKTDLRNVKYGPNVSFKDSDLQYSKLDGMKPLNDDSTSSINFDNTDFTGVVFGRAILNNASFKQADFENACLKSSQLSNIAIDKETSFLNAVVNEKTRLPFKNFEKREMLEDEGECDGVVSDSDFDYLQTPQNKFLLAIVTGDFETFRKHLSQGDLGWQMLKSHSLSGFEERMYNENINKFNYGASSKENNFNLMFQRPWTYVAYVNDMKMMKELISRQMAGVGTGKKEALDYIEKIGSEATWCQLYYYYYPNTPETETYQVRAGYYDRKKVYHDSVFSTKETKGFRLCKKYFNHPDWIK